MKVFVVFRIFGEGDSYSVFDFDSIHSTLELAQEEIANKDNDIKHMDLLYESMTEENNYTLIGKRPEYGTTRYSYFGGYIIEEMEVK